MNVHVADNADRFPDIRFRGQLRPSQRDVVEIARRQLGQGQRRLHVVAPPGSGKTVLGLYLWAECIRRPAVVLSPNSAIQAQWAARTDLFHLPGDAAEQISTDPKRPGLITSLTYQSVTLPQRGDGDWNALAIDAWQDTLIEKGQAKDPAEAAVWIDDLKRHNRDYFEQRLAAYRKVVRDLAAADGQSIRTLHESSAATLDRLGRRGIGMLILDECHHLLGHWGRVLADARETLGNPVVVGLTATPPDRRGKRDEDVERYDAFFGPVDFEVPVPAVVKDGFLAPYQDVAYFVRPTAHELSFVANADEQLHRLVDRLCRRPAAEDDTSVCSEPLPDWLARVLAERRLPTGTMKDWAAFERRDPDFADAARLFLLSRAQPLPDGVPDVPLERSLHETPEMEILVPVLDRYIRHRLRRSDRPSDHTLAEQAIDRLRTLGVQVTETGCRMCASPVGRVLAYSRNKAAALVPILEAEMNALGRRIRAVVVSDYEKTSAVSAEVSHLLDAEAGGAVAAFKMLLAHETTDGLDPILVTGSTVLVDDDVGAAFDGAAREWLAHNGYDVELVFGEEDGFHTVAGRGADWCPRVYVEMVTELFQRGLTRCLVGTRGLLGEGWDAAKINVLVDLTTVTTSMSVNQLRGRSIRLDSEEPEKLADNWDVVCIAPEFSKGLDDYRRFKAKHRTMFGVTDDGAVEKGVGHVHAAFTELQPEGLEGSMNVLNDDMLARAALRKRYRDLWRIGRPYRPEPIRALELHGGGGGGGFPPFSGRREPWNDESLVLAVGRAVLGALAQAELIEPELARAVDNLHVGSRAGGYVRIFLQRAAEPSSRQFIHALHEAVGPLDRPRYVIPRYIDRFDDTWLSKLLPSIVRRYFQHRERRMAMLHAVPTVLARNKGLVAVYARHWNRHVSPGRPVYAHRGSGEKLVERARRDGMVPTRRVHDKSVFL